LARGSIREVASAQKRESRNEKAVPAAGNLPFFASGIVGTSRFRRQFCQRNIYHFAVNRKRFVRLCRGRSDL